MGMLLDTVCNFFGGIVLIALLVALTASNETSNNPDSDVNATRVEEKINQLKNEINSAESYEDDFREAKRLLEIIKKLQNVVKLHEKLEALVRALKSEEALNVKINKEINRIKNEIALRSSEKTRFPLRKPPSKDSFIVIVAHGKIYPVFLWNNGKRSPNIAMVDYRKKNISGKEAFEAVPKPGLGLLPSTLDTAFINALPDSFYLVFAVYEDSFSAFDKAKRLVALRNFDLGWEPYMKGEPVFIDRKGIKPDVE